MQEQQTTWLHKVTKFDLLGFFQEVCTEGQLNRWLGLRNNMKKTGGWEGTRLLIPGHVETPVTLREILKIEAETRIT